MIGCCLPNIYHSLYYFEPSHLKSNLCLHIKLLDKLYLNKMSKGDQSVAEYLRDLTERKNTIPEVTLQFKSIADLLPYLHLFEKLPKLRKLSLHGNRIKQLPTNLGDVFPCLEQLDITNNLLDDNVEMTILSLKTLPRLRKLSYQVKKEKEKRVGEELRSLEFLNNTRIIREKAKKEYEFKNANEKSLWEFEEVIMEHFASLTDFEKKYLGEVLQADGSEKFRQQISQISRQCLDKLNKNKQKATETLENIMLYTTKFDMFEMLKLRCVNLCQDIYSDIGKFLKSVLEDQDRLFKLVSELTLSLARIELDQKQKQDDERYNNQFQSQHSIVNKNAIMQKQLKRMRKQKDELIAEITQLQTHNKKLTDAIFKYTKGDGLAKSMPLIQTFQSGAQQPATTQLERSREGESGRNVQRIRGNLDKMSKIERGGNISNNYVSNKSLTIKQLKDTIEQIYDSKLKFDEKNFQGKLARETMNQYLFTYLNQKYGLKSLTIQAASNIVSGIQEYSSRDNDIAVFGKILRNEVDEQFRFVQAELKSTINDLLKMHIKTKTPYKSASEVNDILARKLNGDIAYEECQDLVRYLYNKADANEILTKLEPVFLDRQRKETVPPRRRGNNNESMTTNRGKIEYFTFLQHVLNFQLKNHQKLLRPLVNAFKLKDKDSDGIVDEEEFISIIELLCQDAGELIPSLLDIVDPYETKAITFTQMVRLVANYPENNPILNRYAQKTEEEYPVYQS